jgi:hypothetical protein
MYRRLIALATITAALIQPAVASDHARLIEKLSEQLKRARGVPSGQRIWIPQSAELHLLAGVPKSEILAALGATDACATNDECSKLKVLEYCFCPLDRPSGQVLVMHFDDADRVTSATWAVSRP